MYDGALPHEPEVFNVPYQLVNIFSSLNLNFCYFMTVTQRMCLSVSPWTVALISLLNCFQKPKNLNRRNALRKKSSVALHTICGSDGEAKLSVAEVLSVKNLPVRLLVREQG